MREYFTCSAWPVPGDENGHSGSDCTAQSFSYPPVVNCLDGREKSVLS